MGILGLVIVIVMIAVIVAAGIVLGVFLAGATLTGLLGVTTAVYCRFRTPRRRR